MVNNLDFNFLDTKSNLEYSTYNINNLNDIHNKTNEFSLLCMNIRSICKHLNLCKTQHRISTILHYSSSIIIAHSYLGHVIDIITYTNNLIFKHWYRLMIFLFFFFYFPYKP